MKSTRDIVIIAVALLSLVMSLIAISSRKHVADTVEPDRAGDTLSNEESKREVTRIKESLDSLADEVAALKIAMGTIDRTGLEAAGGEGAEGSAAIASVSERLSLLESPVGRLQGAFDGIDLEQTAEERKEMFQADDGFEKADAYFEAGKYTIAADGYLQFVQAHPDHPDSRNILERARRSYEKAGYSDMAIWVQEEMMKSLPESRPADLMTLAAMEKSAGRMDSAVEHSAEAAELATDPATQIWNRMYWAWYKQLRDGTQAGLDAYLQVQTEIQQAGLGDQKMAVKTQEKIDEMRKLLAADQGR